MLKMAEIAQEHWWFDTWIEFMLDIIHRLKLINALEPNDLICRTNIPQNLLDNQVP